MTVEMFIHATGAVFCVTIFAILGAFVAKEVWKLLFVLAILAAPASAQTFCVEFPTQCGPGGCFGGSCQPQYYYQQPSRPQQRPQPDGDCTPQVGSPNTPQFQPLPPPPPVQTPPLTPPQPAPTVDWDAWDKQQRERQEAILEAQKVGFESVVKAISELPRCNCKETNLTEVNAKLDQLITASSKAPAVPPATQPAAEEHVVVVADHNAPYWQKLAEQLAKTRQTYKGVQDTTLPNFPIGIHPQAIVYRNSVPVRIVKGQHEVDDLLSRLSRGDAI